MKTKITFFSMALLIAFLLLGCSSDDENATSLSSSIPQAPKGAKTQYLLPGSTIADIQVQGVNVKWYVKRGETNTSVQEINEAEENDLSPMISVPLDTQVINKRTYYATQTVNNVQSLSFLAVKVYCYEK